jgi:ATP-dependent RNA helicase RhlE
MSSVKFADLSLIPQLQTALKESGYEKPTPIQAQAIPLLLKGHDLLGIAQTGTGKTAAFSLPILQYLFEKKKRPAAKTPRCLILTPTRELAIQIQQSVETYGKHLNLKSYAIFGGVGQNPQVRALQSGLDILIATPGRLLDLYNQRFLNLKQLEIFVLDEADRMLDMGFAPDIKKILPLLPQERQNLFFSATMPPEIQKLASSILNNPKTIEVTPQSTTAEKVKQQVMYVTKENKFDLLLHVLKNPALKRVLVFVEMKHVASRLMEKLIKSGISASAIHGNRSQSARQNALEQFRTGEVRVLFATDIASRGIDIDEISHVINFDIPHIPENYVHRIGRTARAGTEGIAISFCTAEEKSFIFAVEKINRQKIEVVLEHPFHSQDIEASTIMSVGKAKAILEKVRDSHKQAQRNHKGPRKGGPRRGGGGGGGPRKGGSGAGGGSGSRSSGPGNKSGGPVRRSFSGGGGGSGKRG